MPVEFAGVDLLLEDPSAELREFQDSWQRLLDTTFFTTPPTALKEVARLSNRAPGRIAPPRPNYPPEPKVRINELYWPTGAARWARGIFLADTPAKDAVESVVQLGGTISGKLKITDEDLGASGTTIEVDMFMLPPRPVSSRSIEEEDGERIFWLLPLVDQRWYWQQTVIETLTVTTSSSWADVYDSIQTALGITISDDAVPSEYLIPDPTQLSRFCDNAAVLLDAVAHSVGQRIVIKLDGTVEAINWTNSKTRFDGNLDSIDFDQVAGDQFNDQRGDIPEKVAVCFPKLAEHVHDCDGEVHRVENDLAELADLEFEDTDLKSGQIKTIHSTAYANFTGGSPANSSALDSLAEKIAVDFGRSLQRRQDRTFVSLVLWEPTGYDDHSLFALGPLRDEGRYHAWTRIQSAPYNFGTIAQLSQDSSISLLDRFFQIGKADAFISAGGSGTISIFDGTAGSETDTGLNVTAFDWLEAGAVGGSEVHLWFNCEVGAWYFKRLQEIKKPSVFAHRNSSNQNVPSGTTATVILDTSIHSDPEALISIAANEVDINDTGFFHFSIMVPYQHTVAGAGLNPNIFVEEGGAEIEAALETKTTSPAAYEAASFDFTRKIITAGNDYRIRFTAPASGTWDILGGGAGVPNARIDVHKVRDL